MKEQLFELEFKEIVKGITREVRKIDQDWKFSISGTPLISSSVLVVGNNWGGYEGDNQITMPLCNDILAYPTVPTYRGYFDFFLEIFGKDKIKTMQFLNSIVLTNGNFIRTPNENDEYNDKLEIGFEISNKYLRRIIDLVKPLVIVCFGNSERSATSAISKAVGLEKEFWKLDHVAIVKTNNNWNTYHFDKQHTGLKSDIFSFPHASRLSYWKNELENNENFKRLRNLIYSKLADV